MCTTTNPTPMRPVTAMTYFLPTAVEYNSTKNGLRRRGLLAAVPLTGPRVTTCATTQTLTPRRSGHEVDERLDGADELGPQVGVGPHAVAQPGPEAVDVGTDGA